MHTVGDMLSMHTLSYMPPSCLPTRTEGVSRLPQLGQRESFEHAVAGGIDDEVRVAFHSSKAVAILPLHEMVSAQRRLEPKLRELLLAQHVLGARRQSPGQSLIVDAMPLKVICARTPQWPPQWQRVVG